MCPRPAASIVARGGGTSPPLRRRTDRVTCPSIP
jgi:hypothetical protein